MCVPKKHLLFLFSQIGVWMHLKQLILSACLFLSPLCHLWHHECTVSPTAYSHAYVSHTMETAGSSTEAGDCAMLVTLL